MAAKDLTAGSVPLLILHLALPVLASFTLQSLYALADLYFVGRLGGAAIAGLSIALNLFFVTLSLGMVLGVGALATVSQAYGRGEREGLAHRFQQVLWLVVTVGGTAWLAAWLGADAFFAQFTADPHVHALGVAYFRPYTATLLTQLFLMACSFSFRAVGDFITPTLLMAVSVSLNIVLDPLLIFGWGPVPRLGMTGAALATVLAQVVAGTVYLWRVLRPGAGGLLALRPPLRPDWAQLGRMLRIGLPAGLQMLFFAAMLMVTYRVVRPFGPDATAATGVGFRIVQAATLPVVAIGAAVSSLAGQNFGAHRVARVRQALHWGVGYTVGIVGVMCAVLGLWPALWVGFFTAQPAIRSLAADYLVIYSLGLPLHGAAHMVTALAQGLGRTMYPMLGQAARVGGFLAGLGLFLGTLHWGVRGIFWSGVLAFAVEFVAMAAVLMRWRRTLLADSVPGDSVPGDSVPGDSVPGDSVPGEQRAGGALTAAAEPAQPGTRPRVARPSATKPPRKALRGRDLE